MYLVMAFVYWFFTVDTPPLPPGVKSTDLAGVIVDPKEMESKERGKRANEGFMRAIKDYRTFILHLCYAACFGTELTVLRFAVGYFIYEFGLSQETSGFIILCFSFCNLFARSIGGLVADVVSRFAEKSLQGRVWSLFIVLFAQSLFLIGFSFGSATGSLGYTIFMLIAFSLFVQAAEGVTFAIVPFVQPDGIGPVAGIVGAGGNVGAMIMAFAIFARVPTDISYFTAWLVLGIFVFVVSFAVLGIKFSDEEIKAADEKMNTWNQIEKTEVK
jgi:NNP family nitrate/nitrite transporter-like MFS transporter